MKKRSTIIIKTIGNIFAVLIIFYLIRKLVLNWYNIKDYNITINYFLLVTSIIIGMFPVLIGAYNWRYILSIIIKKNIPFFTAIKIHFTSWLYRYIPGKVNSILVKIFMCNNIKISKKEVLVSTIYESSFIFLSSSLVSLPLFIFLFKGIKYFSWYYLAFIILILCLGIIFIFTPILSIIINYLFRLFGKQSINNIVKLPNIKALKILFYYLINRTILGLAFFILINAFTYFRISYLPIAIAIFAFAGLIGNLINIAPSGLGVREGALVFMLQIFFPLEIAIVLSLMSRGANIISDLLLFSSIPIISKYEKNIVS